MDGLYCKKNIAIERLFPGFYINGQLYRPLSMEKNLAAKICLSPHMSTWKHKSIRLYSNGAVGGRGPRMGELVVFAYDMVAIAESNQINQKCQIAFVHRIGNSKRVLENYMLGLNGVPNVLEWQAPLGAYTQTFLLTAIVIEKKFASTRGIKFPATFSADAFWWVRNAHNIKVSDHITNNVEISSLLCP